MMCLDLDSEHDPSPPPPPHTHTHAQLSIILNNMQHIKTVIVKHLKDHSQEKSGKKLTEEQQAIETHSKTVMKTLIESAGEDIDTKIADIICRIVSKVTV